MTTSPIRDEAGLTPNHSNAIEEMVKGNMPMSKWLANVDCRTWDHFEDWLASNAKQMLEMQARMIESGQTDDDLTTHCAAKGGAFISALMTYRLVKARMSAAPAFDGEGGNAAP